MEFAIIVAYFATIYIACISKKVSCFPGEERLKIQPAHIKVVAGERVQANCTIGNIKPPYSLRWRASGEVEGEMTFQQYKIDEKTQTLLIQEAGPEDSGFYNCILTDAQGNVLVRKLQIFVHRDRVSSSALTSCDVLFYCDTTTPMFCRYLCDGKKDCINGADEINCSSDICAGQFRCNNSKCIDYKRRCDNNNDCSDWSDEDKCSGTTEIYPKENESVDDQMTWLKTTVYTVIACTVGVVLFISVVVIAIFRIKMKRAAVRRAIRQAERRRRHGHHCDGHGHSSRSQRNNAVEHEPFISSPSPTHFGNIIVNVNNGVQFVPNADFNTILQAPPSYSEVIAENRLAEPERRHSPPPEYSTIDRNPNRLSEVTELDIQNLNLNHQRVEEVRSVADADNSNTGDESANIQLFERRTDNAAQNNSASDVQVASPAANLPTRGTSSLGRPSSHNRQSRNVRSIASPRRPKQLQVRDGQIVLDENSSNSSSPETVNRNTQTNPADITPTNQNPAKPSQLQVQAGNIILTNQAAGDSVSEDSDSFAIATEGASSAQGQLEVKDGQIVFKMS